MTGLPIGEVSRRSGVKVPTIRYYEEAGLMPLPARTNAGRRTYGDADVRHLQFIRHARELGFEVDAIRQLLGLSEQPNRSCSEVDVIARAHLRDIESKIARLTALQAEIQRMLNDCAQGRVGDCRVMQVLADHQECASEIH